MDYVKITDDALSADECTKLVTSASYGAISLFIGTTRDSFRGKKVLRLEYEAYTPMAEKEMKKICGVMRQKWPGLGVIAMHHRLGLVPVTETSVIIAVSSPHRQAALEATQYAMDTLKASVPIWKREVYEDGSEWKSNKECAWS